ncbi:MAG: hypothetical protein RIR10_299, partial [Planctomycetota bacterium]
KPVRPQPTTLCPRAARQHTLSTTATTRTHAVDQDRSTNFDRIAFDHTEHRSDSTRSKFSLRIQLSSMVSVRTRDIRLGGSRVMHGSASHVPKSQCRRKKVRPRRDGVSVRRKLGGRRTGRCETRITARSRHHLARGVRPIVLKIRFRTACSMYRREPIDTE